MAVACNEEKCGKYFPMNATGHVKEKLIFQPLWVLLVTLT